MSKMGITRRPAKASEQDVAAFIGGAPDAGPAAVAATPAAAPAPAPALVAAPAGRMPDEFKAEPTRKTPISLTVNETLLKALDAKAARNGISRAAAFALAARQWVDAEK